MQHFRKSQMEILGLAFVFVILIFGLIIFLRLSSDHSNPKSKYIDPQLAASTISAMLKTSVDCGQYKHSLTNLLKDCANLQRIHCNEIYSCEISNNTIKDILNVTLEKFHKSFYFNINSTNQGDLITLSSSNCNPRSKGIFYPQPFDIGGRTLFINLKICDFN